MELQALSNLLLEVTVAVAVPKFLPFKTLSDCATVMDRHDRLKLGIKQALTDLKHDLFVPSHGIIY